ncbi:MAG: hypothetical protein AAB509_03150 [Patescibacteria group bacterium]
MFGNVHPVQNEISEDQFLQIVDGKVDRLTYQEIQALRWYSGCQKYDKACVSELIMPDRIAVLARRKIREPCLAPCAVPPL